MATVKWNTGQKSLWCPFKTVNLNDVNEEGVYIIGCDLGKLGIATIYVGKGDIADRLKAHRRDRAILKYAKLGTLRVTWAKIRANSRNSVERFVADELEPLEGDRHPDDDPVEVNLPSGWF